MSGLVIKLAPNERLLINGAIIENGDRRTRISIRSPNANVLRLKDALHPDQASTPVARVCYVAQLLLSGDADRAEGQRRVAVARNGDVVPRSAWEGTVLTDGDRVEVLVATAGG